MGLRSRGLRWKDLVAAGTEGDAALLRRRVADRQLDLDALALAADLEFDPARAGDAARGRDGAGDAAAATVQQLHVLRAEEQRGVAVRRIGRGKADAPNGSELDSPMKP